MKIFSEMDKAHNLYKKKSKFQGGGGNLPQKHSPMIVFIIIKDRVTNYLLIFQVTMHTLATTRRGSMSLT